MCVWVCVRWTLVGADIVGGAGLDRGECRAPRLGETRAELARAIGCRSVDSGPVPRSVRPPGRTHYATALEREFVGKGPCENVKTDPQAAHPDH